ncbi:hypothetical protein PIB30_041686 [Stylosanthes scabra]|uniref:Uncharacterized protein n=1 Tax=Stylosanthes scabra TaxID=79078 RepID=A0ABU6UDM2_9FABA|nr:hypothetical protein [Stylosanthes scabra]
MEGSPNEELQFWENRELPQLAPDVFVLKRFRAELNGRMEEMEGHLITRANFKLATSGCSPGKKRLREGAEKDRDPRVRINLDEGSITNSPTQFLFQEGTHLQSASPAPGRLGSCFSSHKMAIYVVFTFVDSSDNRVWLSD